MFKYLFFLYSSILSIFCFSNEPPKGIADRSKKEVISFTENKGQISDQYSNLRTDVLFSGTDGKIVYHIRKNGISYQVNRIDSYKIEENKKSGKKRKVVDKSSIYRIDASWLDINSDFTITKKKPLREYSNYYNSACPNGVFNVRSYQEITLNNIYNKIDLKYYQKDGVLKYDFIVAPKGDYRKIQIEIKGAKITLQKNGSVLFTTPLGTIEEGAPVVFQNNNRLKSFWVINNNILSFEIEGVDSIFPLIIDPPTRIWGTYYGGTQTDIGYDCVTDKNYNVYLAGKASSPSSSVIATTGSHQSTLAGGSGNDAFLAKFDSAGVRIWATYYGGVDNDQANSCAVDTMGNVFIAGTTNYISTSGIASPGAHQVTHGGGIRDAFLVKFNSSGIRQWGTYYGGNGDDYGSSCIADLAGNVYLTGASSSTNSAAIATPGTHLPTYAGNQDAFLVKFNSFGIRQWGTYYGGSDAFDYSNICMFDTIGNVYMCGITSSTAGIATPGAHQIVCAGSMNSFLAKFDQVNGTRIWGTYYGGGCLDRCYGGAISKLGFIYISGQAGNSPSVFASPGCFQPVHGGGTYDAFLAKFNLNGLRIWGTFYGGTGDESAQKCSVDRRGNVFFTGTTASSGFSTPPAHQNTFAGGLSDAFLVKFDSLGKREWGTYYGESCDDVGYSCTSDNDNGVYLAGETGYKVGNSSPYSGTLLATPGSQQPTFGGAYNFSTNAFLAKFYDCQGINLSVSSTSLNCYNVSNGVATVTATGSSGYTFTWMPTGGNNSTANGLSAGLYTVNVQNSCGIVRSSTVQVLSRPQMTLNVSANSATICPSKSSTLTAIGGGGSGTLTYSWSTNVSGTTTIVSPTTTTTYSAIITDTLSCVTTKTIQVTVLSVPSIALNSGTICAGSSFSLGPSGAATYTYLNGASIVSPSVTTTYSVIGTGLNGCSSLTPAISTITVFPKPTLNVIGSLSICIGATTTLQATGANNYVWNSTNFTPSIVVAPTINTTYTLSGTDNLGCNNIIYPIVVVNSLPLVAISSATSACIGSTINLNAMGANTYTWSNGSNLGTIAVSPTVNTSYSLTGTDINGCINTSSKYIVVNALPFVFAQCSNTMVCAGTQVTFNGNGANSYAWSGGVTNNTLFTPSASAVYTVVGTDLNGCQNSGTISILVNPLPVLNVVGNTTMCVGETVTLTASGGNFYSWSSGNNTPTVVLSPSATTMYSVTGTDLNGCNGILNVSITVNPCVGINEIVQANEYLVYPNPNSGTFFVSIPKLPLNTTIELYNSLGQKLIEKKLEKENEKINIEEYSDGIYLMFIRSNDVNLRFNIVKNQ